MNFGHCNCTKTRIEDRIAKYLEIGVVQGNDDYLHPLFDGDCNQKNGESKYLIACHNHVMFQDASSSTTILLIIAVVLCLILLAVVIIMYRKIKTLERKISNRNNENEVGTERPSQP